MTSQLRIRTGIPDELDGESIAFANVFERPEQPGHLSVLLVFKETQTVLAPGDIFSIGASQFRLAGIEPHPRGYVVVLDRLAPAPVPPHAGPVVVPVPIPAIGTLKLAELLKAMSPELLAALGGGGAGITSWSTQTSSSMSREWNGGEIGPVATHRHVAAFTPEPVGLEASVTVTDIRYDPSEIARQEISAHWRAGDRRAHIFLRAEGIAPMTSLYATPEDAAVVDLIVAAIGKAST